MREQKRTADEFIALIKERATQFGPWPPGITVLVYPSNDSWEVLISPGKAPDEEGYRVTALWIAVQMQAEFDLRGPYVPSWRLKTASARARAIQEEAADHVAVTEVRC